MSNTEDILPRLAHASVTIQITPESKPAMPSWMGEVAAFAQILTHEGILTAFAEQVRFARARFGHYDLIDFVAVLIGYVVSGEPTLLAFYEQLSPRSEPFMALFGRNRLPHRSTLSRFLAALDQPTVEALRTLFHKDLLAHKLFPSSGGLVNRTGGQWLVVDVDGTRQAARQRALPQTEALPAPHLNCAQPNLLPLWPSSRFTRASLLSPQHLWSVRLSNRVNACGVWTSEVRPPILYARLPWFRVYSATRWHLALSCQPPTLSRSGSGRQ